MEDRQSPAGGGADRRLLLVTNPLASQLSQNIQIVLHILPSLVGDVSM